MKKWTVVIPTIREEQLKQFIDSFRPLFEKHVHNLIIVEDNPKRTFEKPEIKDVVVNHLDWEAIDKHFGSDSWIIPRRTDCIRSAGFWVAHEFFETPYILTLDDDVRYNGVDIFEMYELGFKQLGDHSLFFNTMNSPMIHPRGYPFKDRVPKPVMLQWGMWHGVPDLDGVTQLQYPIVNYIPNHKGDMHIVGKGEAVTGCIMNCAFKREVIPAMYQLLMGQDKDGNKWPYDRWGDIWSGHLAKKYVEDVLGGVVAINYAAHIKHERASNVYTNLRKELSGYEVNEKFWDLLTMFDEPFRSYDMIADTALYVGLFDVKGTEFTDKYWEAMKLWTKHLN